MTKRQRSSHLISKHGPHGKLPFVSTAASTGRNRRSLGELKDLIRCATDRNPSDYINYGCWCGVGGSEDPVDQVDQWVWTSSSIERGYILCEVINNGVRQVLPICSKDHARTRSSNIGLLVSAKISACELQIRIFYQRHKYATCSTFTDGEKH